MKEVGKRSKSKQPDKTETETRNKGHVTSINDL